MTNFSAFFAIGWALLTALPLRAEDAAVGSPVAERSAPDIAPDALPVDTGGEEPPPRSDLPLTPQATEWLGILPHYQGRNITLSTLQRQREFEATVVAVDGEWVVLEDAYSGRPMRISVRDILSLRSSQQKPVERPPQPQADPALGQGSSRAESASAEAAAQRETEQQRNRNEARARVLRLEDRADSMEYEARATGSTASTQFWIGLPAAACCGASAVSNLASAAYFAAFGNSVYAASSLIGCCAATTLAAAGSYLLYRASVNDQERITLEVEARKLRRKADSERMDY